MLGGRFVKMRSSIVFFFNRCLFVFFIEELKDYLLGDNVIDRIFILGNFEYFVSWDNEVKFWIFFEDRVLFFLKTYKIIVEVIRLIK